MSKKPRGRFLLTWNEKKDPEISEFFNNIEEGMYSHTLREVIKFYMNYKDGNKQKEPSVSHNNSPTDDSKNIFIDDDTNKNKDENNENSDYTDISASDF